MNKVHFYTCGNRQLLFLFVDVDLQTDGGITLAFALWSRSAVLLELGNGEMALSDLQHSLACGLPAKQHGSYYLRLARANACKFVTFSFYRFSFYNAARFLNPSSVSGNVPKADICIKLAERLCQDSETLRGLERLKDELNNLKSKSVYKVQGIIIA